MGIAALESAARSIDRWIATAYSQPGNPASSGAAVDRLVSQGVDGIVLIAPQPGEKELLERSHADLPFVSLYGESGGIRQREAIGLAVSHLVSLGHTQLARLSGPDSWLVSRHRDEGIDAVLADSSVVEVARWRGDWSAASGARVANELSRLLHTGSGPTAVVAANDQMALGLIAGLSRLGHRVPGDISITGFDNMPDSEYYLPSLTTVQIDLAGEALLGLSLLTSQDSGNAVQPLAPSLVIRESTAPPQP